MEVDTRDKNTFLIVILVVTSFSLSSEATHLRGHGKPKLLSNQSKAPDCRGSK